MTKHARAAMHTYNAEFDLSNIMAFRASASSIVTGIRRRYHKRWRV